MFYIDKELIEQYRNKFIKEQKKEIKDLLIILTKLKEQK